MSIALVMGMMNLGALTLMMAASLLASGIQTEAVPKLSLRVSPAIGRAPGYVTVTATVQPDAGNRRLEIVADSGSFYSSSEIQLEGEQAPLITQLALKNLPDGQYSIVVVLQDLGGRRTVARSSVTVLPRGAE
jgi:hypothetical protein